MVRRFLSFLHFDNSRLPWFESPVHMFGFKLNFRFHSATKQTGNSERKKKRENNITNWMQSTERRTQTIVWILFVFISHPIQCRLSFVAIIYIWILFLFAFWNQMQILMLIDALSPSLYLPHTTDNSPSGSATIFLWLNQCSVFSQFQFQTCRL